MTDRTPDQLTRIGDADELHVRSRRGDGTLNNPRSVWVVRDGNELYLRSVNGRASALFRGVQRRHAGHIRAGGVDSDVALTEAGGTDDAVREGRLDAAYRSKVQLLAARGGPHHQPGRPHSHLEDHPGLSTRHTSLAPEKTMTINLTLNNGVTMPALGFGVFQTPPDVTAEAVAEALRTGYRLIDTAAAYANERGVGEAIAASGLSRQEVFIETKVWISDYGYDATLHAFDKSAGKLGVDQIDLLILHQPLPSRFDLTLKAYRALETLLADGRVRAIGVSNFMPDHLDALLKQATIVPAVNQVEVHPYFTQPAVQAADADHGIITQAWSPIGGITSYRGTGSGTSTFDDPTIGEIAKTHGKTPAQVMIRWHLQEGRSAIPKSVKPARIAENFDVFDFELSATELAALDGLDTGVRGGPEPADITLETFGRDIPEA